MAHGAPDNYQVQPRNIVYVLQDDAELAVRLGAVSSIDRLGNVLFFDDFSNGKEAWFSNVDGEGAEISISGQYYKHGGFSLKHIAGSDGYRWAQSSIILSYPDPSKQGTEINFSINNSLSYLLLTFVLQTGSKYIETAIKLDFVNNTILYVDSEHNYQTIANISVMSCLLYTFHSLKLVADFITGYYTRVIFDGISYNLSTYLAYNIPSTASPLILVYLTLTSVAGVNGISCLDSVIITRNEP